MSDRHEGGAPQRPTAQAAVRETWHEGDFIRPRGLPQLVAEIIAFDTDLVVEYTDPFTGSHATVRLEDCDVDRLERVPWRARVSDRVRRIGHPTIEATVIEVRDRGEQFCAAWPDPLSNNAVTYTRWMPASFVELVPASAVRA